MRNDVRVGGGVALFIRDTITFIIRTDIVIGTCEAVFIEISSFEKDNNNVAAIYRSPRAGLRWFGP